MKKALKISLLFMMSFSMLTSCGKVSDTVKEVAEKKISAMADEKKKDEAEASGPKDVKLKNKSPKTTETEEETWQVEEIEFEEETEAETEHFSGGSYPVNGSYGMPAPAAEPPALQLSYAYERYIDRNRRIWISPNMVSESSSIYQKGYDNRGYKAFDGDPTSSWQIDTRRTGIGEYVDVYFDREQSIRQITLLLGNHRSYDWFVKNHVPRTLSFQFDGANYYGVVFQKSMDEFLIEFSQPINTRHVRITIDDIYPGSKYDDTVIADIGFYY